MPPHWENVNTELPYQVRAAASNARLPTGEVGKDRGNTLPTSLSSLFLCTVRHTNTMKSLVSLGKQWTATELKGFREFKT